MVNETLSRVYPAIDALTRQIIGENGSRFTPIIGAVSLAVMAMSLLGLVRGYISPAASIRLTIAFASAVLLLVQYHGVKRLGLRNHIRQVAGRPVWLLPVKLPFYITIELLMMLILAVKLFGRILGADIAAVVLILIGVEVIGNILIPVRFPMVMSDVFTSFVQAMVCSMLVAVYISETQKDRASSPVV